MDFTVATYNKLIQTLLQQGFSFQTFIDFIERPESKVIILRHDVDKNPENSLEFAKILTDLGIKGTYYFRVIPHSWNKEIIKQIAEMGYEIGYHYEEVGTTVQRHKGIAEKEIVKIAIADFAKNLKNLRKIVSVKTICMHGNPISRWDSRLLWKYYDYHDFGIIGEPYFDIDFDKVLYLTDTGRRWDGDFISVRDKAQGIGHRAQGINPFEDWKVKPVKYKAKGIKNSDSGQSEEQPATSDQQLVTFPKFHSTFDIIKAVEQGKLPDKIMMTFHPQRWTDKQAPWVKELVWQNVKNVGKYFLIKLRD